MTVLLGIAVGRMSALYDQIGRGYAVRRRPEPRIYSQIRNQLEGAFSILNVGAGVGSYEPYDIPVIAVEPSIRMILQRHDRSNVIQANAESLPFFDGAFDSVMTILTIHLWRNQKQGLEECARTARQRVVILTWDPASDGFWLVRDYLPEILEVDRKIFPTMEDIKTILGKIAIQAVPVPADCTDGFLGAYWRRPHAYLDETIRSAISSFFRIGDVEKRLDALRKDLISGAWKRKYGRLLTENELDIGYRLITAERD